MTTDELTTQFPTFQGELKSFLLCMTACVQDAEDIVQDMYLKARSRINTFRGDSSLKTWVFSIASKLAKDLLKSKLVRTKVLGWQTVGIEFLIILSIDVSSTGDEL